MSTQKPFDPNAYESPVTENLPTPLSRGDPVALILSQAESTQVEQVPVSMNPAFQAHFANLLRGEILERNDVALTLVDLWQYIANAAGIEVNSQAEAFIALDEMKKCSDDYVVLLDGLNTLITGVEGKHD